MVTTGNADRVRVAARVLGWALLIGMLFLGLRLIGHRRAVDSLKSVAAQGPARLLTAAEIPVAREGARLSEGCPGLVLHPGTAKVIIQKLGEEAHLRRDRWFIAQRNADGSDYFLRFNRANGKISRARCVKHARPGR